MKTNKTEILVLVDRSGSMESIKNDIEGAFKNYLAEQKKLDGECYLTLAQFDTQYEIVYENRPIKEIDSFTISPRGGTALLDSLARLVDDSGKRFSALKEEDRPAKVVVLILSDGETNSDRYTNASQIKEKIKHQESKYSWSFIFIGTNFDAVTTGADYGIACASSLNFANTTSGINAAFSAVNNATSFYRCSTDLTRSYTFTDDERKAAADLKDTNNTTTT